MQYARENAPVQRPLQIPAWMSMATACSVLIVLAVVVYPPNEDRLDSTAPKSVMEDSIGLEEVAELKEIKVIDDRQRSQASTLRKEVGQAGAYGSTGHDIRQC